MTFVRPEAFWFLAAIPLLVVIYVRRHSLGRRTYGLLSVQRKENPIIVVFAIKTFVSGISFVLAYTLLVFALSGPSWGQEPLSEERRGVDITFVVDVSRSMLCEDIRPSRLEKAKEIAAHIVAAFPQARTGVVVFKGSGVRAIPLTEDATYVTSFLARIEPSILTDPGTNIASGLGLALKPYEPGKSIGAERHRCVILFSDGEDFDLESMRQAKLASDRGIPVFTVTCGTEEGGTIPTADGVPLVDASGAIVVTKANPEFMEGIAMSTTAKSYLADEADSLVDLTRAIEAIAGKAARAEGMDRYRSFLYFALFFLAVGVVTRFYRWRNLL